ncbi:MAG: TIGR00730 family Rossman fold protein [Chitinophagales bacterium]
MKSICVFCGSNAGTNPEYAEAAKQLGYLLVENDIRLIFGGGNVGLMGIIADAVLEKGGEVIGVIPHFLMDKEVGHTGLTEMKLVNTMHQRKELMAELSDAFITMPGGIGTMEEFFEIFTWGQLGLHPKPFGILNVDGYYDHLLAFFETMVSQRFLSQKNYEMLYASKIPADLLQLLKDYKPNVEHQEKWLDRTRT